MAGTARISDSEEQRPRRSESFSLSELVQRTGVPASSIHHYRRSGAIPPPAKEAANRFRYDHRHVEALLAIRSNAGEATEWRHRIVTEAIAAFQTRSFGEVSMSDIADSAGVAKGTIYRHFESKADLFDAVIETLLADTANNFAEAVADAGGPEGLEHQSEKAALIFGNLVAAVLPILLELGARAAKGNDKADRMARHVLRTLAEAGGRPFVGRDAPAEEAVQHGLSVIETAFSTVLTWALGQGWPPDEPLADQLSQLEEPPGS